MLVDAVRAVPKPSLRGGGPPGLRPVPHRSLRAQGPLPLGALGNAPTTRTRMEGTRCS